MNLGLGLAIPHVRTQGWYRGTGQGGSALPTPVFPTMGLTQHTCLRLSPSGTLTP